MPVSLWERLLAPSATWLVARKVSNRRLKSLENKVGRSKLRISMIGCGYVGLVTGACLAEAGHQVVCTDNDSERIAALRAGVVPIYEPHLDAMLAANCRSRNLSFTSNARE